MNISRNRYNAEYRAYKTSTLIVKRNKHFQQESDRIILESSYIHVCRLLIVVVKDQLSASIRSELRIYLIIYYHDLHLIFAIRGGVTCGR